MKIENGETYKIEFLKDKSLDAENVEGEVYDEYEYNVGEVQTVMLCHLDEKAKTVSICIEDGEGEDTWHCNVAMDSFKLISKQIITWKEA